MRDATTRRRDTARMAPVEALGRPRDGPANPPRCRRGVPQERRGSLLSAPRMRPETAGNRLRAAAATRCLAEVYMRAGEHCDATRTAFLAATYLYSAPADDETTLVLRGSAFLSAAAASARRGDSREARASFVAAVACAEPMQGERSDFGAVFGPVNTAIHRVAVAVQLGDYKAAVDAIPAVDLSRLPVQLAERRARYLIDVARTHAGQREDQAAEDALLEAERAAPDELRSHRLTHAVLRDLLTRDRRSSNARSLASRCGVLPE